MVQLMKNGKPEAHGQKMAAVKNEIEDPLEEEHGSLLKRQKQQSLEVEVSLFNPLDEPSPLGLRLRKSPSLLELIQMKLSQSSTSKAGGHSHGKKESKGSGASGDKLKASNFPASVLRIGTWEYKSRYEGDLVAKCYFAKHKLVWEVLDGGLKNKIEIQWSDIMALKANYPDDAPGTLDVVLARQPLFFRETNPQPRKHTLWQATSDFTGEQASINRRHYLECPQGLLGKHFEKLTQCDPRLYCLSQQGEITLDSPFFEPRLPVLDQNENSNEFDLNGEGSPSLFSLQETASPSGAQSPSKNDHDFHGKHTDFFRHETPSPSSVVYPAREILTIEDIKSGGIEQLKALGGTLDQVRVHGLHSSMSMSDLVSHLEQRVSEQASLSNEDWESLEILDDINRCLFSDIQEMPDSDEKLLMSRVNSLCCLVQKDGSVMYSKSEICVPVEKGGASTSMYESDEMSGQNQGQGMSRKDSVGDLLLNLPRIASLPQFLVNIPGDYENEAR